jgi:hypothetical protein
MNEERAKALRAQIWALFDQHGGRMTLLELYRLVMQAEVFGRTDLEALTHQAGIAAIERVLQQDPELRRRFDEEGVQALHDPLVVVRLQQAIEADLADFEETE